MDKQFQNENSIAWSFLGHGDSGILWLGGLSTEGDSGDSYDKYRAVEHLHHKLAEVIILTCNSMPSGWRNIVSKYGILRANAAYSLNAMTTDWEDLSVYHGNDK